jgi:hypothetical protein
MSAALPNPRNAVHLTGGDLDRAREAAVTDEELKGAWTRLHRAR